MFTEETRRDIAAIATGLGIEPAALLAVAEVESSGKAFAMVGGRAEPLIRFEGHYFDKRLSPSNRARARREGLASPVAGAVANPRTQAGRWTLLAKARAINAAAADESVSWGLGQVMGAHWAWLGHASIDGLVAEARGGVAGQIRLMVRYIEKAGLVAALRHRDWEAFARGYNGPQYKRYGYHTKIAAAYARYGSTDFEQTRIVPEKLSAAPSEPAASPFRRAASGHAGNPLELVEGSTRPPRRESLMASFVDLPDPIC